MRVLCETEVKVIAEILKETQYFYMENYLWPNGGVKTMTYLSRISTNTFTNKGQVLSRLGQAHTDNTSTVS